MSHDLDWFVLIDALAFASVALRMSFGGLFRAYPAVFIHAIYESALAFVVLAVPFTKSSYGYFYDSITPLRWILWIAVVVSLYRQTLGQYGALVTIARRVLIAGLVATGLFVAFTLHLDLSNWAPSSWILTTLLAIDRALATALALLVLSLCAFLAWFVIPTRRNCAYLCVGLGIGFACRAATSLIRNAGGQQINHTINLIAIVLSVAVYFALAAMLNPSGEHQTSFVVRRPSPREVEAAISKLGALTGHLPGKIRVQ